MADKKQEEYMHVAGQVFLGLVNKVYGTDNFADVALKICGNPDNIIGEGTSKYVYKIDGIDSYVLACLKKEFDPSAALARFEPCEISLPRYNFGQILFDNGQGLIVMKKSEGVPHSLERWINHCRGAIEGTQPMSRENAEIALLKICEISRMPIETFNHLAMQIKYLNEYSLPMDTINPNNLLVDVKNKQINLIDVFDGPECLQQIKDPKNGVRNMEAVLLDSMLHTEYMKALSPGGKELLKFASGIVIDKCQKAASNVGLVADSDNVRCYFETAKENSKRNKIVPYFLGCYEAFVTLYEEQLAQDEQITVNQEVNARYEREEVDYLQLKMDMLKKELGDKMGKTADKKTGKINKEHHEIADRQVFIAKEIMKMQAGK